MAGATDQLLGHPVLTRHIRRLALALVAVASSLFVAAPASSAKPPPGDGGGVIVTPTPGGDGVGIGVKDPGKPGGGGLRDGDGNGTGRGTTVCSVGEMNDCISPCESSPYSAACQAWSISQACADGEQDLLPPGACKAAPPPVTAETLAQEAYGTMPLVAPSPSRYPSGTLADGRPYTIVQTHMWFSTSPGSWSARSKTVCAGALCATAVARPTTLTFDPGNGDSSASCRGPGTAFQRPAGGSWVPGRQPQGCDYQYTKSSYGMPNGEVTSTYTIGWTVTWTATNGQGGTFNDLQTAATSRFAVAELQSVVTEGRTR